MTRFATACAELAWCIIFSVARKTSGLRRGLVGEFPQDILPEVTHRRAHRSAYAQGEFAGVLAGGPTGHTAKLPTTRLTAEPVGVLTGFRGAPESAHFGVDEDSGIRLKQNIGVFIVVN